MTTISVRETNSRLWIVIAICVLAIYLVLSIATALTERPGTDEGYFANPAYNLLTTGSMSTTVLETFGTPFKGMDRHTYWIMPFHPFTLAGWYKLFGFGVFTTRAYSIFWGLIALISLFVIVRSLFSRISLGLIVVALLSCDYIFIVCAASGRMDMMSAALGFAGLAVYLTLRERALMWAVFASQSLIVMSGLTHPMGILPFFGLLFVSLYLDRKRLGIKHVAVALAPYVIGGLAWGSYIAQDRAAFFSQFSGNATMGSDDNVGGRFVGLRSPLIGLKLELTHRYLSNFGVGGRGGGATRIKILFLALYVAGVLGSLLIREIRTLRNYKLLVGVTVIYFIGLTFIDSQKAYYYLVHIVPFYLTMCALFISWCWARPGLIGKLAVFALAGIALVEIAGLGYRIKKDNYRTAFQPAVNFLHAHAGSQSTIAANSGTAFGLGFPANVVHDPLLGYNTGKKFDYIVIDPEFATTISTSQGRDPKSYEHTMRLLTNDYTQLYDHDSYTIYARKFAADYLEKHR